MNRVASRAAAVLVCLLVAGAAAPAAATSVPFRGTDGYYDLYIFTEANNTADPARCERASQRFNFPWKFVPGKDAMMCWREVIVPIVDHRYATRCAQRCRAAIPDDAILNWFGTAPTCGMPECPAGWQMIGAAFNRGGQEFGERCFDADFSLEPFDHSKALCMLTGRPSCAQCSYFWAGTAPVCLDTCDRGDTIIATSKWGDGQLCSSGLGQKYLCERCKYPLLDTSKCQVTDWIGTAPACEGECQVWNYVVDKSDEGDGSTCRTGSKYRCGYDCPKKKLSEVCPSRADCGAVANNMRWAGKPIASSPTVTGYFQCCARCRRTKACKYFNLSKAGCQLFSAVKGKAKALGSKAGTVVNKP